ncbi:hypothetical protein WN51_00390 [Melipona quadrifasciata]|uniref:Uncharacterized protein n=1 Tax=Melipona quadrifasciata TaxID=166423 RepID=A0A0M9A2U7_9HYME|nr:hypothetical protein WN51_00390 [Melipona quadrifasciata]
MGGALALGIALWRMYLQGSRFNDATLMRPKGLLSDFDPTPMAYSRRLLFDAMILCNVSGPRENPNDRRFPNEKSTVGPQGPTRARRKVQCRSPGTQQKHTIKLVDVHPCIFELLRVILTGAKKDCKVCSSRNKQGGRHETTYYCDTCPDKPRMYLNKSSHVVTVSGDTGLQRVLKNNKLSWMDVPVPKPHVAQGENKDSPVELILSHECSKASCLHGSQPVFGRVSSTPQPQSRSSGRPELSRTD